MDSGSSDVVTAASEEHEIAHNRDLPLVDGADTSDGRPRRALRARGYVNYNEDGLIDKLLPKASTDEDGEDGDERPGKKARRSQPGRRPFENENQREADTAHAVGLSPNALDEEEENFLPESINQSAYLVVRNHVLSRWRSDVSKWLTVKEAGSKIHSTYQHLVVLAWHFLTTYGYINFGVAPAISAQWARQVGPHKESVIIIGAGLAGLSAARQLRHMGHQVVVLEGRDRPGGRVYSKKLEAHGHAAVSDLGGAIITGIDGNPLAVLARQLDIPMHRITSVCPLYYDDDGSTPDAELDKLVGEQHDSMLDAASKLRDELPLITELTSLGACLNVLWHALDRPGGARQQQLCDWHRANLEFANAALLEELSLRHWDQDDLYELEGEHVFLPGGNLRLVQALAKDIPVFYNTTANAVRYAADGVEVASSQGTFRGDAVLVTVPLGVLKRGLISFNPPLPQRKVDCIRRLGFGVLNKVVLLFPHCFWDEGIDTFGRVLQQPERRGEGYLFYCYASINGSPVLAALVAGQAALALEGADEQQVVADIMAFIRRAYEPQNVQVPEPLQAVVTRWGSDPLCYGSYSNIVVGSWGPEDYDIMAESIGGRLFFAGEATTRKYPATMHGAFASGLREAANITAALAKSRGDSAAPSGLVGKPKRAPQQNGQQHQQQLQAQQQAQLERQQQALKRANSKLEQLLKLQALLVQLFSEADLDLEFGAFAALYGPKGSVWEQQALMQVDLRRFKQLSASGPPARQIYMLLARPLVDALADMVGDDARLHAISNDKTAQVVGRASDSSQIVELLEPLASKHKIKLDLSALKEEQQQQQQQQEARQQAVSAASAPTAAADVVGAPGTSTVGAAAVLMDPLPAAAGLAEGHERQIIKHEQQQELPQQLSAAEPVPEAQYDDAEHAQQVKVMEVVEILSD